MKFYHLLPNQKLILTRIETPPRPARPLVARSTHRPRPEPLLVAFILWLVRMIAPTAYTLRRTRAAWSATIRPALRANWLALTLLTSVLITVLLETLAADYVTQMVGA